MDQTLGFRMIQAQTQKLIMNQEMRQAISILQYSSQELTSYIEAQLENNPVFDIDRSVRTNKKSTSMTNPIDLISSRPQSLAEVLLEQLSFHKLTSKQLRIGTYLIGLLDDDGYLRENIEQIASFTSENTLRLEVDNTKKLLTNLKGIKKALKITK